MSNNDEVASMETTCGLLLCRLQQIWNEIGEPDGERDKMLLEIEQECLRVYSRKVEEASKYKAQLQKAIADRRVEIADINFSMGGQEILSNVKPGANLSEELKAVTSHLEEMRKRKYERKNQFIELIDKVGKISLQLGEPVQADLLQTIEDETDLSFKKLEELGNELVKLQREKRNRLEKIEDNLCALRSLCLVIGMDFKELIYEIHPTLAHSETNDVSIGTIERLAAKVKSLRIIKTQRMQKLLNLAVALLELWNLLGTPIEEQMMFQNVTSYVAASEDDIIEPNMLSINSIKRVEDEVWRLNQLKSAKIKEIIMKKKIELEEICRTTHMVTEVLSPTEYSTEAINSGVKDPEGLLEQIDLEIAKVKEEASSRKEILEKMEKWLVACQEECWLEEYNRDDNRYNAGRGAHLTLKRAEKARSLVNKIPGMVEALTSKTIAWENEKGIEFLYDGVSLLSMLEEYKILQDEKELQKQRQKDQRKIQVQFIAEQETLYGSKSSPAKSGMKATRPSDRFLDDRKLSVGGAMLQNMRLERASPRILPNSHQKLGALSATSSHGRRISEIPNRVGKKNTLTGTKSREAIISRKPLSPVPLKMSSKANMANSQEPKKETYDMFLKKTPITKTPTKLSFGSSDEENIQPKSVIPTTPAVLTVPMMMANTPATPYVSSSVAKPTELSFEEERAAYACNNYVLQS